MRDRRDVLQIHKCRRTYDREHGSFSFHVEYETHTELTERTIEIAESFGLGVDDAQKFPVLNVELKISPKDIVYITGDSGSGKSVLLRALRQDLGDEAIGLSEVQVIPDKPLIETIGATIEEALELLSKVGLNDAFLFLRKYNELSDGQRCRYILAKFLECKKQWLLIDEFAATLDRDTAKIVAFNVQKLARQQGKAVIAATTHDDLFEDLSPSVHVHKRFGEEIDVKYYQNKPAAECSLFRSMTVESGALEDWRKLCHFHYRSHNAGACRKVFRVMRGSELCGVIVYVYPPPGCQGRRLVLPKMSLAELNQNVSMISRIVIHPKYRSIGLGAYLIRESLPLVGTSYVEMVAVMAKYNPFAEKAGMRKVSIQEPPQKAVQFSSVLSELGFDLQLLSSERYVRSKLQGLNPSQMSVLKEALVKCDHPRLRKEIATLRHVPYGTTSAYREGVENADLTRLVKLVKIIGVLLQTKVYLFWERSAS